MAETQHADREGMEKLRQRVKELEEENQQGEDGRVEDFEFHTKHIVKLEGQIDSQGKLLAAMRDALKKTKPIVDHAAMQSGGSVAENLLRKHINPILSDSESVASQYIAKSEYEEAWNKLSAKYEAVRDKLVEMALEVRERDYTIFNLEEQVESQGKLIAALRDAGDGMMIARQKELKAAKVRWYEASSDSASIAEQYVPAVELEKTKSSLDYWHNDAVQLAKRLVGAEQREEEAKQALRDVVWYPEIGGIGCWCHRPYLDVSNSGWPHFKYCLRAREIVANIEQGKND